MDLRFLWLLISVGPVCGRFIEKILGDSVEFRPTAPCKDGEQSELFHTVNSQLVASLEDGSWKPGRLYTDRLNQSASLILHSVNINDGGNYEFTCNGQLVEVIELSVIIPQVWCVFEGEDAKLPCHSVTAEKPTLWLKDGELVLQTNSSGKKTYGTGWEESKVSMADDWQRRGDMSLTIKNVNMSDRGLFFCKSSGQTVAVRLEVRAAPELNTPPLTPSTYPLWIKITLALLACVVVLLLIVVIVLVWKPRSYRCGTCCQRYEPGGGGEPMEAMNPKREELNVNSSVNEQRTEETRESENDPQSTQPLTSNGHSVTLY